MPPLEETFDELMRASYEDVGTDGSPVRMPASLRRLTARFCSLHPELTSLAICGLHRAFALGERTQTSEVAKFWCQMAGQFTLQQTSRFARAVARLDDLPTFQRGCRELGYRNCLEAMLYRAGMLDVFFEQGPWQAHPFHHPHQRPHFFVPGIPAQRYYDPAQFAWTEILEKHTPVIREELLALFHSPNDGGFGTFRGEYGKLMTGWNAFHFWVQGERVEENCRRCPRTAELLDSLPGMEREFILFSALNPNCRIIPHVGAINGILRFHLPLIVPPDCGLRVGGQTTTWEEGKVLVFDDSFVHEVWNHSDQLRVVLFINAWHPCLSKEETVRLSELQNAYDKFPAGLKWKEFQQHRPPSTVAKSLPKG